VALMAGLVCLSALAGALRTACGLAPAALGSLGALAGLAPSMPAGSDPRPVLAVLGLVAGVLAAAMLAQATARTLAVTAVVVLVVTAALVSLGLLDGAGRSVSNARLTLASADRKAQTSAALSLAADHPLTGTGPGRATLFFTGSDGEALAARYVHNEYLQVLAELGAVGLALVVVLLGALARSVRSGRASAPSPLLWAGGAAGLVALCVHSAVDFLWHVPALPLGGALLVGLTFSATTTKEHA